MSIRITMHFIAFQRPKSLAWCGWCQDDVFALINVGLELSQVKLGRLVYLVALVLLPVDFIWVMLNPCQENELYTETHTQMNWKQPMTFFRSCSTVASLFPSRITDPTGHREDVMQLSQFDYLRRSVEALISGAALALQVGRGKRRGRGAPVR